MSEYKPPISRDKAMKSLTKAFQTSMAELFGDGESADVEFNRIADDAHGEFNDHVADGTSARLSKAAADEEFYESFRSLVQTLCDSIRESADELIGD